MVSPASRLRPMIVGNFRATAVLLAFPPTTTSLASISRSQTERVGANRTMIYPTARLLRLQQPG